MRAFVLAMMALTVGGCAVRVKDLMATGPVLDAAAREKVWPATTSSGVEYTGEPHAGPVPLPFMVFGAVYDTDLVLVTRHPHWNMHELAMLRAPEGPVWIAKDAREGTLEQLIVADVEHVEAWFPEIPVKRKSYPIEVHDQSTAKRIDVKMSWENFDGEKVTATFRGKRPQKLAVERNGPTMGHSRDAVIAVLDVSKKAWGSGGHVEFDGKRYGMKHILGVVPFRFALTQTQGGICITDFTERGESESDFESTFVSPSGSPIPVGWTWKHPIGDPDTALAETRNEMRTLRYTFRRGDDAQSWELTTVDVLQWDQPDPATHIELSPPLPDLRRPFAGRHTSRFVVDINGQRSHAVGTMTAVWEGDTVEVSIDPEQPAWTADRPMKSEITFENGEIHLRTTRREKKTTP